MKPYSIGIDLGGTRIKAAAVTTVGEVLSREGFDTRDNWAAAVKRIIEGIETRLGAAESIGLAAPGLVAPDGQSIGWMRGRLHGLEGLNWTAYLGRNVRVLNDAHAALLGESWLGAAVDCANVVMLTLGTGVGGAILCDGKLLRGHLGRAGHLGHIALDPDGAPDIVGTRGSLEDAIGEHTVWTRSDGRFASTLELVAAYKAKDPDATSFWLQSVGLLATGIASIINIVDPEVVVLGGGIANAADALFDPLRDMLGRMEWRPYGSAVRVIPAALGEFAGAIGAARCD